MHAELARLLHHACRRPDDPIAGLVLADWLEEHGDEKERDRAQFIRIENVLASLRPYEPRRAALTRQAVAIRAAHEGDWVGDLAEWAEGCDFHRGLTTLLLRETAAEDGALVALAARDGFRWVCAAQCRGWKARQVNALSNWAGLNQVGHLEISGAGLNARAVKALQHPGLLAGLEALHLGSNSLGDGGSMAVAECADHAALVTLTLSQNGIGPAGAKALAASPHLGGIKSLYLDNNVVGDEGLRVVAHSEALAELAALYLHDNEITATGARDLAGPSGLPRLRVLGLGYNTLMPEGVESLARAPLVGQVEELLLRSTNAGNTGTAALVNASLPRLRLLDLSHNGIGPSGIQALALAGWLSGLESLRLSGNVFGVEGARLLAARRGAWALRALDLSSTGLKAEGVAALLDGGVLTGLEELNLGNNQLASAAARALAGFAWPDGPPSLDLRHNLFTEQDKALLRERFVGRVAV